MELNKEAVVNLIWANPGIKSYSLLAKLIEMGYIYREYGDNTFENIIDKLKSDRNIRYDTVEDRFYVIREMSINITIESDKHRVNCYDCRFMQKLENNKELKRNADSEHDAYCALDTRLTFKLNLNTLRVIKCPFNNAIDTYVKEND